MAQLRIFTSVNRSYRVFGGPAVNAVEPADGDAGEGSAVSVAE